MLIIENIFKFIEYKIDYKINDYFDDDKTLTNRFDFEELPGDEEEEYCNCNLCYVSRNILYCFTRKLICKKD